MSEEISIRLATEADIPALVEFNRAMAKETEGKDLSPETLTAGVVNLFKQPQYGFYLVAEAAGQVIGGLMITTEWSDWRNGLFWWIQSVYVNAEYRQRGVYSKLYAYVKLLAAPEKNVCGFRLYVEKENVIAQKVYEKLGMTETHYKMFEELN